MKRRVNWRSLISWFVLITLILSIFYAAAMTVISSGAEYMANPYAKQRGDYLLMLLQCVLGVVVMMLPSAIERRAKIEIPNGMYLAFVVFLYCSVYLGEVRNFYYTVPHWDTILHAFSGVMLGALGFALAAYLNGSDRITMSLNPLMLSLFAFCFAVTMGVLWEVYEFGVDSLFGLNMQKAYLENGTPLIARDALADTMKDLIVDLIGAFIMSLIGYISMGKTRAWIKKFKLKKD